jgi:hypothetical protein
MDGFPCLVIRGICDYADSFKNDAWHRYAATTAAAYAKEFLLYVSPQQLHESQPAREVVGKSYSIWCMTCTARLVRTALAIEK